MFKRFVEKLQARKRIFWHRWKIRKDLRRVLHREHKCKDPKKWSIIQMEFPFTGTGHELLARLELKDTPLLNGDDLDYLLNHPREAEALADRLQLQYWGGAIEFFGTVYQDSKGVMYVQGIARYHRSMIPYVRSLDQEFCWVHKIAVSTS